MSNFICPTCGFTNIDYDKEGYNTDREIELEKKLEITVNALEEISKLPVRVCCDNTAQEALAKIKEIK